MWRSYPKQWNQKQVVAMTKEQWDKLEETLAPMKKDD
jgi:hypothetical protein